MAASDQIVVAGEFDIFVAPEGSTVPTDSSTALDPAFVAVGLTTRDGSAFQISPEFKNVESHQSQFPTRTFRTKVTGVVRAALQEWNETNFTTAFGGGTITEDTGTPGEFRYDPPAGSGTEQVIVVLEMVDGTKRYRFVVENAQAQSPVELPFTPDSETVLPLELAVLGDGSTAPWYLLTNDPAFSPTP
jgi:hypothetical protein